MANRWDGTKWVDDETGNQFIDGVWHSPQGTVYSGGKWISPNNQSPLYAAQTAQFGAQQQQISSKQGTLQSQLNQQPYMQASLNAKRGVLGAQAATLGPKSAVIGANAGVIGAQGAQLAGTRGLIGQQQQETATRRGEFEQEQAAKYNVKDQAAVATAQRYRAAEDARNRTLGILPSAEINAPPGTVNLGEDLAPGVRAKLTTQFEDVSTKNQANQQRRGFDLETAKLAVQLMGTDVDQARLVAAQAGLTLDQAQLAVEQAQNTAGFAGADEDQAALATRAASLDEAGVDLQASQADLNARLAGRAPFAGAVSYTDPATGQSSWMTPSEADNLNYQHQLELGTSRVTSDYAAKINRDNIGALLTGTGGFNQDQAQPPLSAFSEGALANMYKNPQYYVARGIGGFNSQGAAAFEDALVKALAAKLKGANKTFTSEQALSAAQQYLDLEMTTRKQAAGPPSGGGSTVN